MSGLELNKYKRIYINNYVERQVDAFEIKSL